MTFHTLFWNTIYKLMSSSFVRVIQNNNGVQSNIECGGFPNGVQFSSYDSIPQYK